MTILDDDLVISVSSIAVGTSVVQLDTSSAPERLVQVIFQADDGNTGDVYIGGSDVSADASLTLDAKDSITFGGTKFLADMVSRYNLGGFYALGSAASQKLKVIKVKRQRDL